MFDQQTRHGPSNWTEHLCTARSHLSWKLYLLLILIYWSHLLQVLRVVPVYHVNEDKQWKNSVCPVDCFAHYIALLGQFERDRGLCYFGVVIRVMEGKALPELRWTHEEPWEVVAVCNHSNHVREDWWRMGTRVSRQCIYIPHVSHLTQVIDRQTESFCHTKFSTAASCPIPSSPPKVKKTEK